MIKFQNFIVALLLFGSSLASRDHDYDSDIELSNKRQKQYHATVNPEIYYDAYDNIPLYRALRIGDESIIRNLLTEGSANELPGEYLSVLYEMFKNDETRFKLSDHQDIWLLSKQIIQNNDYEFLKSILMQNPPRITALVSTYFEEKVLENKCVELLARKILTCNLDERYFAFKQAIKRADGWLVEVLIRYGGCNVNAILDHKQNITPLMLLAMEPRASRSELEAIETAKVLIGYGAKLNSVGTMHNLTAYRLAELYGNHFLAQYLTNVLK